MQIEVSHLVKEYKRKRDPGSMVKALASMFHPDYERFRAVDDINFQIAKGEAVGYVGPNGSGKSTTIKMLSGVLTPTEGQVLVNGMEPTKARMKVNKKIGVVFGNRSVLWWDVPVMESYRLLQTLYEIPEERFRRNLEEFTELMEMERLLGTPERQLSLGQKIKCNIAAAFLHDPEIVFLDEPTIGLDSESKYRIRKFIKQMNEERKTTFIVTSHDFQDIESLCHRIILINHGKLVVDDHIENVRKNFDRRNVVTTGQIVFYQEGLIDMSGPGAKYTIYSKTCNVVLSADPTDDLTHAEHEREIRMAGLKAAEYLASCVRDSKADLIETWELDSHDSSKPRIGYVYLLLAQGLLHDNYLYGNNIRTVHPCILHPNELMDGAVVSGNCVTACDKNTTYDHLNNPVLKELYERHGKELDFCGVIVSPISPVLEEKERCALGIANLCALLGLDGVIISEEGGGNPESDLMLICRRLEQEGISTVLLAHENCGKDGTAQGITIVTKEADAVVSAGNANEIITLPPMDRVIGVPSAMNQLSGALENSLKPDGSIETTYTVIMDAISNLGIMPLGVETY